MQASTPHPQTTDDGVPVLEAAPAELVRAARALVSEGRRTILGITGAPGAGKSTLAELLVTELGPSAVLVGMDGFHLSDPELRRLGRWERKGAADTFDAAGYVHLLRRLRSREDDVVYAPVFDRAQEQSIGSAVPVPASVPLVVTEGNYLLSDEPPWSEIRRLLDACWYVDPGEDVRVAWLIARHLRYGRSEVDAHHRSHGSDGTNARVVHASRHRASMIIRVAADPPTSAGGAP